MQQSLRPIAFGNQRGFGLLATGQIGFELDILFFEFADAGVQRLTRCFQTGRKTANFVMVGQGRSCIGFCVNQFFGLTAQGGQWAQHALVDQENAQAQAKDDLDGDGGQKKQLVAQDAARGQAVVHLQRHDANHCALLVNRARKLAQLANPAIRTVGVQEGTQGGIVDADAHHALIAHDRINQGAASIGRHIPQRLADAEHQHFQKTQLIVVLRFARRFQALAQVEIAHQYGGQQ